MAEEAELSRAVEFLKQGNVVGIPTETVYGLAASISQKSGIEKIFHVKERPFFDPLIVHVANKGHLEGVIESLDPASESLIEKFWPGPLALVLPKKDNLNPMITSGLSTVAVRMPDHPVALKLIELSGPLAAPSANKFGKTSPTTAEHVRREFAKDGILVLDGGPCTVGIESTILGVVDNKGTYELVLHRPGLVSIPQIEQFLRSKSFQFVWKNRTEDSVVAPGQVKHHYMPTIPLILADEKFRSDSDEKRHMIESIQARFPGIGEALTEFSLPEDSALAARLLYAELRKTAELGGKALIYYYKPALFHSAEWKGIADRLTRAASLILN